MGQGRPWPLSTERIVKYIANSAAKNMSSLDNQMMVPTLTRFGRLAGVRGTGSVTDAVATKVIITTPRRGRAADPQFSSASLKKTERLDSVSRPVSTSVGWSSELPGEVLPLFVGVRGPDTAAVFAIRPDRGDIGGTGGRPPGREQ